jgi:hypothetical protein
MATSKRAVSRKSSIEYAVSEGIGALVTLGEECQESYDNMPESLQGADYAQALEAAADTLANLSEPEIPDWMSGDNRDKYPVEYTEDQRRNLTRDDRRQNALNALQAAVDLLDVLVESAEIIAEDKADDLTSLRDEVQQAIDEAEGVEFPRR